MLQIEEKSGTLATKKSSNSQYLDAVWTDEDEQKLRQFVESKFRERTPLKDDDIYSVDPADRVARSEARTWAATELGKMPPETETEWLEKFAQWYQKMARRNLKKLDPDSPYLKQLRRTREIRTMKAITTKYKGPTDSKGSRIIASDEDGNRAVISYPYELSGEAVYRKAAETLRDKMGWTGQLIGGEIKDGYVFVFAPEQEK
jgi:hypothetical protein